MVKADMTVAITWTEYTAIDLRRLASGSDDAAVTRRLLALALALALGLDGPDLAKDKVVQWRCSDIQARIADLFGISLHERTMGKLLHRLRFFHISTRPRPPKADPVAQASLGTGSAPL